MAMQCVQRLDHIALIYYPETVQDVVAQLERMLGIDIPSVEAMSPVIRSWRNLSAGLVIIAPRERNEMSSLTESHRAALDALYEHLDQRGEGVITAVFGVSNLEQSLIRAVAAGATVGAHHTMAGDSLDAGFAHVEEVQIGHHGGLNWALGKLVPAVRTGWHCQ